MATFTVVLSINLNGISIGSTCDEITAESAEEAESLLIEQRKRTEPGLKFRPLIHAARSGRCAGYAARSTLHTRSPEPQDHEPAARDVRAAQRGGGRGSVTRYSSRATHACPNAFGFGDGSNALGLIRGLRRRLAVH